ncbi:hypothetical protein F2P81_019940 [Scophthalmus maximus]|uniref:SH2 domain-containing protein n=1 Tax=Scophthalmus maximus TaxID=52904 RepID=A0A6A4S3W1_SCOMX|nr:hypothetical protein F2P81_019940 [Scophthalmus maximus]
MSMERLGKLTAPATAKFRQLQKIVQDIKKTDDSFLDKLRRLKNKPSPKVPARDYRGKARVFSTASARFGSFATVHEAASITPSADSTVTPYFLSYYKQNICIREDYISPDGSNDDDNYIEPDENQPANFYEVPDTETVSSLYTTVTCFTAKTQPQVQEAEGEDEYEVCDKDDRSCDKTTERPPPLLPKPLPRVSPKPPIRLVGIFSNEKSRATCQNSFCILLFHTMKWCCLVLKTIKYHFLLQRLDLKPRAFESQTLPVMKTDHKAPPKAFTLDLKRPKIPLPQLTFPKPTDRGSVPADNRSTDEDKDADVYEKPWYASACDRKTADDVLLRSNKDGAFMVRKSSGQDAQQPYTLVVFYKDRVYNIPIRFIANTQQYALGREKKGEEHFSSVCHIIESHQRNPLVLIDSQSNSKDATKLSYPVKP